MPNNFKNINLNLFLFLILAIISALSLMAGKVFVPLNESMSGYLKSLIILELRLPSPIIGILIGARLGTLSYTNLDVSKRQHLSCARCAIYALGFASNLRRNLIYYPTAHAKL